MSSVVGSVSKIKQLRKKYKKTPDRANIKLTLQESPYMEEGQPSMFQIESGDESSSI